MHSSGSRWPLHSNGVVVLTVVVVDEVVVDTVEPVHVIDVPKRWLNCVGVAKVNGSIAMMLFCSAFSVPSPIMMMSPTLSAPVSITESTFEPAACDPKMYVMKVVVVVVVDVDDVVGVGLDDVEVVVVEVDDVVVSESKDVSDASPLMTKLRIPLCAAALTRKALNSFFATMTMFMCRVPTPEISSAPLPQNALISRMSSLRRPVASRTTVSAFSSTSSRSTSWQNWEAK